MASTGRRELVSRWKKLFKRTQALPQAKTISNADIVTEIKAYRSRK